MREEPLYTLDCCYEIAWYGFGDGAKYAVCENKEDRDKRISVNKDEVRRCMCFSNQMDPDAWISYFFSEWGLPVGVELRPKQIDEEYQEKGLKLLLPPPTLSTIVDKAPLMTYLL